MTDWFADLDTDPTQDIGARSAAKAKADALYTARCDKCGGSGRFRAWSGRDVGPCHACKGVGQRSFATPPFERAKARKVERIADQGEQWLAANPEVAAWLTAASARGFHIASDLASKVRQYGSLTDAQVALVTRFAAQDAERAQRKAAEAKAEKVEAKVVAEAGLERLEATFARALERSVKNPKLRLGTFVFSPAKSTGRNPGAIYVKSKELGDYLGKIVGGRFERHRFTCDEPTAQAVAEAASDPEASALAYGQRFGQCSVCGKELTKGESIDRAIGPVCYAKWFG